MNTNSELDRIVSDWLEVRVADPPHGSLAAVLTRLDETAQQRHWWQRWWDGRWPGVAADERRLLLSLAAAVAGAIVLAVVATFSLGPRTTAPVVPVLPASSGTTWSVALEGGDFSSIGEAVAAAADGDTVLIEPGTYEEAFVVDRDITLAGGGSLPSSVIIRVPADAPDPVVPLAPDHHRSDALALPASLPVGIQLVGSEAIVRNLQVIGHEDGIAVLVLGGSPTLEQVTLRHEGEPFLELSLAGSLYIEGGAAATVDGADVYDRVRIGSGSTLTIRDSALSSVELTVQDGSTLTLAGSTLAGQGGCADISVVGGSSATFADNTISGAVIDVRGDLLEDDTSDGTSARFEGNHFDFNGFQTIVVSDAASATVTGNDFTGNQQGVLVEGASADIRDNAFYSNWNGVTLKGSDVTFADNLVRGGSIGVSVVSSGSPDIRGNTIEDVASRGIFVADGTSPVIEGNSICGSPANLMVAPEANPTVRDNDICPDEAARG